MRKGENEVNTRFRNIVFAAIALGITSQCLALTCLEEKQLAQSQLYLRRERGLTEQRTIEVLNEDATFTAKEKSRMKEIVAMVFASDEIEPTRLGDKVERACKNALRASKRK